jgi:hypothetical protein
MDNRFIWRTWSRRVVVRVRIVVVSRDRQKRTPRLKIMRSARREHRRALVFLSGSGKRFFFFFLRFASYIVRCHCEPRERNRSGEIGVARLVRFCIRFITARNDLLSIARKIRHPTRDQFYYPGRDRRRHRRLFSLSFTDRLRRHHNDQGPDKLFPRVLNRKKKKKKNETKRCTRAAVLTIRLFGCSE